MVRIDAETCMISRAAGSRENGPTTLTLRRLTPALHRLISLKDVGAIPDEKVRDGRGRF